MCSGCAAAPSLPPGLVWEDPTCNDDLVPTGTVCHFICPCGTVAANTQQDLTCQAGGNYDVSLTELLSCVAGKSTLVCAL